MKTRVKIENNTFEVEIVSLQTRPILAKVDGETFEVWPEEVNQPTGVVSTPLEIPSEPIQIKTPLPAAPVVNPGKVVSAPIPGVIIDIKVHEGDEVKYGQELCTLEAMKMKNAIRATRDGKIARVFVTVGQQVPHNTALMEFVD
jgi:biotin carboxyl carrier protein